MQQENKLIPWTPAEEAEGRRLNAGGLSSIEVHFSLMMARLLRYEAALTEVATYKGAGSIGAECANIAAKALPQ